MKPDEECAETGAPELGALLDAADAATVTLVAGETRLVAHRAVLAARSPALAAKLRLSGGGQLAVADVEGPVLREALAYLYTLQVPRVSAMAPQLLAIADEYGLPSLKAQCEQWLLAQLSVQNAAAAAVLAVKHSCDSLRPTAVKFVKAHTHQVMATQGWANAVRTEPVVLVEVCRLLSELPPETSKSHVSESNTMKAVEEVNEATATDLGSLLDDGDTAVVTLVAGDTRLVAHRAVLAARSPVFAAKFRHDTQEASSGEVAVPEVDGPVLRQLLAYFYTLQAPQLPGMAAQLLAASDMYGVSVLKAECERQVAAQLSVETAAATAVLAVRHSCDSLRPVAVNIVKAHTHEVMATQGWAEAVRTRPKDVVELSRLLSEPTTDTSVPCPAKSGTSPATRPHIGFSDHDQIPASAELPTAVQMSPTADAAISQVILSAKEKSSIVMQDGKSLIQAAEEGAVEELKAMLDAGADVEMRETGMVCSGWTALHCAANGGHEQAVRHLLAAGAEVDVRDIVQRTPLHWAAVRGHAAVVRQLVAASADPNARDEGGLTPLHLAAWYGHAEAATALLEAGADLAATTDQGSTPLDIARLYEQQQLMDMLRRS